jgi:hypothetical protein
MPRARAGRLEVCLGWLRLPLRKGGAAMLWHNGGTGGFRSFAACVPDARAAAVVLSTSARSVDRVGIQILRELASST